VAVLDGADVHTPGRLLDHQKWGVLGEFPAEDLRLDRHYAQGTVARRRFPSMEAGGEIVRQSGVRRGPGLGAG
jgi:hypothetical protein